MTSRINTFCGIKKISLEKYEIWAWKREFNLYALNMQLDLELQSFHSKVVNGTNKCCDPFLQKYLRIYCGFEREENSCHMLHTSYISSCMLRLMSFKLENKNQKHLVRSKFKQKHKHVKELH